MKISVVIPLYNKGPHIAETLMSVLSQHYQPTEILVVDDASTDDGLKLVEAMANPLVRIIRRDTPGPGGYAARNEGILAASGDWIAFIDADDLWLPNHLSSLVEEIGRHSDDVGCAFSRSAEMRGAGVKPVPFSNRHLNHGRALSASNLLNAWLETKLCPMWTGAIMIRRTNLIEAGMFPAGKALRGGDKDLWLRVFMNTNSAFYNGVTAHFRLDAVNRVTTSTGHNVIPILVETIGQIWKASTPGTRHLLLKLINQELALYARYTVGAGGRVNRSFLSYMHWRGGMKSLAIVAVLLALGPAIVRARRKPA